MAVARPVPGLNGKKYDKCLGLGLNLYLIQTIYVVTLTVETRPDISGHSMAHFASKIQNPFTNGRLSRNFQFYV
jgi:hypothetical protein